MAYAISLVKIEVLLIEQAQFSRVVVQNEFVVQPNSTLFGLHIKL